MWYMTTSFAHRSTSGGHRTASKPHQSASEGHQNMADYQQIEKGLKLRKDNFNQDETDLEIYKVLCYLNSVTC